MEKKILTVGDIHGDWGKLNELINKKKPDLILQCGDFGWWPAMDGVTDFEGPRPITWHQYGVKNPQTEILFCDGNHEDHWSLQLTSNLQLMDKVYWMPRGSIYTLPDGRNVLFMGGAKSIDMETRTIGTTWFPEEIISYKDVYRIPDVRVDIVISHTCPNEFKVPERYTYKDCSRDALSYILDRYRPSLWYFGHWHTSKTDYTKGCRWTALNQIGRTGAWAWLV